MKRVSIIGLSGILFLCFFLLSCPAGATTSPVLIRIDNPSPQENGGFGWSVSELGDIDGDGVMDIIIGAPGQDEVFLFSGASRTLIRSIAVPSIPGYEFGWSATGMGDVDGDGVGDIAVGAPSTLGSIALPVPCTCDITGDPCPPECIEFPEFGRIFVFSGASGDLLYEMKYLHNFLGFTLVSPGDLNGDTIPDLIASAPSFDRPPRMGGKVYAFSGTGGSVIWETIEPAPGPDQPGLELGSFGMRMAGIPDISGDGFGDLLVSSPFFDCDPDPENFILCGRAFVLDSRTGAILRTMENPHLADNDMFGMDLSSLDDQDGDGIGDYAMGAHGLEKVIISSTPGGTEIREISRPGGPGGVHFGFAIAETDDKDGDTTGDLWISEYGRISLMNGRGELLLQVDDPDPASPQGYGGFGVSLSPLHDLDGDLSSDLIAGDSLET
ncbi:MAG: integrin alpha, partial [Methanomicrobiales archaeon]|nr:integrin alpha [Methanomicrobiales archaeon]